MENITEKQRDKFAIEFANWLSKLTPSQMVSVWSKNGEHRGLFTMDNEQLLNKYKQSLPKPKGIWKFERSSGYAGCRCQKCNTWIYENQEKKCECDFL